jgi:hypothetical protein
VIRRMTGIRLIRVTCPEEFGRLHSVARAGQESLVEVHPGLRGLPRANPASNQPFIRFVENSTLPRRRSSNRSAFQKQFLKNLPVFHASSSLRRDLLQRIGNDREYGSPSGVPGLLLHLWSWHGQPLARQEAFCVHDMVKAFGTEATVESLVPHFQLCPLSTDRAVTEPCISCFAD